MIRPLEILLILLFAGFLVGSVMRILAMLERKRAGEMPDRARVVFFFTGCLMLVCLIPLGFFDLLSTAVAASDVVVVIANFVGYALTYELKRRSSDKNASDGEAARVRTYQVYLEGARFGLVNKEGFDVLLELGLLKRQRTVELVDDYKRQAREKGVGIRILRSRDGTQTLLKVEGPAVADGAEPE
ncbi:MAG: hypothetical protein O3A47_07920 [Chloroflexi bacterium]|nr:hypothetical protein [Chloroflexota bacterium]